MSEEAFKSVLYAVCRKYFNKWYEDGSHRTAMVNEIFMDFRTFQKPNKLHPHCEY